MDASVAHQRRIRNLFTELETKHETRGEMDNEEEEKVHPAVQVDTDGVAANCVGVGASLSSSSSSSSSSSLTLLFLKGGSSHKWHRVGRTC